MKMVPGNTVCILIVGCRRSSWDRVSERVRRADLAGE